MTDENAVKPKDTSTRDMAVRTQALDWAIRSNCGLCYDTNKMPVHDAEEILKAAKIFESFIKGENQKKEPFIEGVSNHPNNLAQTPTKKDGW